MEKSRTPREKRKSRRVIMYLPLEYRARNVPYIHEGHVVNASEGGSLISSSKDIPVGMKFRLELLFPKGFEQNNFEAEAEIVWKEDGPEDKRGTHECGIRFTQMAEDDQRKLKQLLSGRLQGKAKKDLSSSIVNLEMRRYPRQAVDLPVECCRINSPISHNGRAINASEGGLMVYLPEKVEIGQRLKLMLSVGSNSALDTIDMVAKVVWVDIGSSMAMKGEYRVGAMILDISSAYRLELKHLLESLSQRLRRTF